MENCSPLCDRRLDPPGSHYARLTPAVLVCELCIVIRHEVKYYNLKDFSEMVYIGYVDVSRVYIDIEKQAQAWLFNYVHDQVIHDNVALMTPCAHWLHCKNIPSPVTAVYLPF